MTVYLGTLGRMIPIYSTPSAQLETEERYSFSTTLEGRRKAQARPIGRRTWGLNAKFADPSEHSLLSQFANGAWGPGPFIFVSADALVSNMLTPEAASCHPDSNSAVWVSGNGPVELPEVGWVPRSFIGNGTGPILFGSDFTPVRHGVRYSVSAFVFGEGSAVRANFYDDNGSLMGGETSTVTGNNSGFVRSHISIVPGAGVAGIVVSAVNAAITACPQISEGPGSPLSWSEGQGCAKAVVHGVSRDQVLAVPGNTFSNVSFTVSEVG